MSKVEIVVKRVFKGEKYTIGHLYVDGVYFCDTLEDRVRAFTADDPKIWGQTAIPAGEYKAIVYYWNKIKRDVLHLQKVPHFEGILIHGGVTAEHSHGCILVGFNKIKGQLLESKRALDAIMYYVDKRRPDLITIKVE